MKKHTNYAAGPRGINLEGGATHWVEPGAEIAIGGTEKDGHHIEIEGRKVNILGDLPDFGKKGDAPAEATAEIDRLKAALADETARADEAEAKVAELEAKLAAANKPSGEPGPLDQSVEKLTEHLQTMTDADEIEKLIAAETAGKSRSGALAALKARQDELLA
ncbi:hypothetical protein [Sphingomonas crocodyli]|uniref:Uncharacterized protein n=1 Tax=Sphingomonas crocodyli TaxID=1979270 RepID=A0A437M7P4_9SPHN|nr:hypothetical protein [Sphingomonas crocodyli]RVT93702.1 hypothetical protein EOD43_07495 [Sphingomonas crocodyli]